MSLRSTLLGLPSVTLRSWTRPLQFRGKTNLAPGKLVSPRPGTALAKVLHDPLTVPSASRPPAEYSLKRTSISKFLPIYTDIRNGRTRVLTIIKGIIGNIDVAKRDLSEFIPAARITVRSDLAQISINGRHRRDIVSYYNQRGF